MAQKIKLSLNGVTSYPITIAQAVAVIGKSKTLDAVLADLEALAGVTYSIEKDESGLIYTLKDSLGNSKGTINIPQDTFLDSASFDAGTKKLNLVFNTASGKEAIAVDMSALVDTYTAGNGVEIAEHVVSVKVDSASESYLTVGKGGIKLSGIVSALGTKANKSDFDTHVADAVKHITAEERTKWNDKVDAVVVGSDTYDEVDAIVNPA